MRRWKLNMSGLGRAASLCLCVTLALGAGLAAAPQVASAQQQAQGEVILSIDGLIFEQPDDRSRVLMRARSGERFAVLEEQGTWIKVQLPRGSGWVLGKIVRRDGEKPPIAGFGDSKAERVTVVDEYADVKAGPGDAYLGTRRAFRGDTFVVAQRSQDGEWVQIRIEGELGWIRADQLMAAASVQPPDPQGQGGQGGARVGALDEGGVTIGAGGGGGEEPAAGGESVHLELRLNGVFQLAQQYFASNTNNPRLQQYTASTNLAGTGLYTRAWFLDYLGAVVEYDLTFGAPIEVPYLDNQVVQLSNTAHRFHGGVSGRFPLGSGKRVPWVGVTAGFQFHRFSIQELQFEQGQPPLFLTNTYTGVRTTLEANVPLGPVDLWASGWYLLAPSVDQNGYTSGTLQTANFFGGELGVGMELASGFGFFLRGLLDNYDTTFAGQATRDEGILNASGQDRFVTFSTGVLWRPL